MADDIQIKAGGIGDPGAVATTTAATSTPGTAAPQNTGGAAVGGATPSAPAVSGTGMPSVAEVAAIGGVAVNVDGTVAGNGGVASAGASGASGAAAPSKAQHVIPELVRTKFPDLPQLLDTTESMNQDERDYWYQILPIMTEEQVLKLREILVTEKQQLKQIDDQYQTELTRLNEKHMLEWKEFETKEKRSALAGKEKKAEAEEHAEEEELLKRLSSI